MLQSCVTTDKVTNSKTVQKRKYNKGFYVDLIDKYKLSNFHIKINNSIKNPLASNDIDSIKNLGDKNDIKDSIYYESILIASVNGLPLPLQNEKSKTIDLLSTTKGSKHKRITTKTNLNNNKFAGFESKNAKKNWKAVTGFGLSIAGLLCIGIAVFLESFLLIYLSAIFVVPAIMLCIIGIKQTRKEKGTGRKFAIIGLIIGGLSLGELISFYIVLIIFSMMGPFNVFSGMI